MNVWVAMVSSLLLAGPTAALAAKADCPAGAILVEGSGCVPETKKSRKQAAQAKKRAEKERRRAEKQKLKADAEKKNGSFSMGFSDRFTSTCQGVPVEITAGSTLTGGRVRLLVAGRKEDEGRVDVGETITLRAQHAGKPVELTAKQGMWGTRYVLKVAGSECSLKK